MIQDFTKESKHSKVDFLMPTLGHGIVTDCKKIQIIAWLKGGYYDTQPN